MSNEMTPQTATPPVVAPIAAVTSVMQSTTTSLAVDQSATDSKPLFSPQIPQQSAANLAKAVGPKPFIFDKVAALAKLKLVKDYYMQFEGKNGYNPHFYLHAKVLPLEFEVNDIEVLPSAQTQAKLDALECNEAHAKASTTYFGNRIRVNHAIQSVNTDSVGRVPAPKQHDPAAGAPSSFGALLAEKK